MNKIIVWALFDDGVGSWNHLEYDKEKYEIHSIGINDNDWENYHKIDLRISNFDLIKQLDKLPKPDMIVASPPCESWSIADNQQRLLRTIKTNNIEFFNEDNINTNNAKNAKNLKRDYVKQWRSTLIGMDTSLATQLIIDAYNPKVWVIENPQTSKQWEWIDKFGLLKIRGGIKNLAYYNNYNESFSKKPTIFLSNQLLNLKHKNIKSKISFINISGYDRRSAIPKELLLDILHSV